MNTIVLILVIIILTLLLGTSGIFMFKMYKKLKRQENLLEQASNAIENASKVLTEAVSNSMNKLETKVNDIVKDSKKEVNETSGSVENTLTNGGFHKVN